ncbi:MAG: CPBP family intramembrane glutamic endopeptidase [Myxococcota bacterium]
MQLDPQLAAPLPAPRRSRVPALWAIVGGILTFMIAAAAAIGLALVGVFFAVTNGDLDPSLAADAAAMQRALMTNLPIIGLSLLGQSAVMLAGPFLIARLNRVDVREGLGFRAAHPATFVAASIGVLALGPTSDALVRWLQKIAPDWSLGSLEGLDALAKADVPLVVLLFMMAVTPGFTEEIFFRGLVQRALGRRALAVHVSAITFALIHADPHHVIGVVPIGYFLAWVAFRADSTWPTILAHVVNNAMAVLAVRALGTDLGEVPPLWVLPVGWAACAACVAVVLRTTSGPPAGPDTLAPGVGPALTAPAAVDAPPAWSETPPAPAEGPPAPSDPSGTP